ncbi:MAG: PD-(D/E)XK nuclease family protein, partial [Treponema sp.]|nr:PD-(D/E)XK nuclease family protein [Treponema sp.]
LEFVTSPYYEDFAPFEIKLLEALKKRGVNVKAEQYQLPENNISKIYSVLTGQAGVKLNPNDDSFEIWNFEQKDDAVKYLTMLDNNAFDVWINKDNKEFDNWQKLEGKSLSGSSLQGFPQDTQLLMIGLTTFERPLNVRNIVEWLNTVLNPLPAGFRKNLAQKICESGGYYNEKCKAYISSYIEKYPDAEKSIKKFLPDISKPSYDETEIEVSEIQAFVKNIHSWVASKLAMAKDDADNDRLSLEFVLSQSEIFLLLLDELDSKTIPYSEIEMMFSVLSLESTMPQYSAEVGCKNVVRFPSDFCDNSEKTVWCDFYLSGESENLTYSFLSPAESESFGDSLLLWKAEKERSYLRNLLLTPFVKTGKKLVLVTVDKNGAANIPKSPLLIHLEKYFQDKDAPKDKAKNALNPFFRQKSLDKALFRDAVKVDNRMEPNQEFIEIQNVDYIRENWADHQSYSSLENLIPHPLDYVINNYVNFSDNSLSEIADISTTMGLVAHKIIQTLFEPRESEKESGKPDYIRTQIENSFEQVFEKTVHAQGAILLLKENRLELQKFKKQVRENIGELLRGISENGLCVLACEKPIGYMKDYGKNLVIKHGFVGNLDIKGSVDMLLSDSEGKLYIFDFKWTSSSHRHASLLEENKSVQLALYKELVSKEMNGEVKLAAYFLMPAARFVSLDELKGSVNLQQVQVKVERKDACLLKEIQKSYEYRMDEIFQGKLEETTGWPKEEITYEKNTEKNGLMPMDYYDNRKNGPYESIGLIKGRKGGE